MSAVIHAPTSTAAQRPASHTARASTIAPRPKRRIYLSHSSREMYTTCGRKYRFAHVDRLRSDHESANLGFGKAVHRACEVFLHHQAVGEHIADPIAEFERCWSESCQQQVVEFSSLWDFDKMLATGRVLVQRFMDDWVAQGLTVILDRDGKPVLERKLRVQLPDNVIYTGILDVLAMTKDYRVGVIDIKTPGVKGFDGFSLMSEQLLGQQVLVDAHAEQLGIDRVDVRAFYNLLKVPIPKGKGEGPRVQPLHPVARASDQDIADWIDETVAIANDIRAGRFPKRPGDAFNSPCAMCVGQYFGACSAGDFTGLTRKEAFNYADVRAVATSGTGSQPF